MFFWGSDVGQSAAAGGNAGYFKIPLILTPFSSTFLLLLLHLTVLSSSLPHLAPKSTSISPMDVESLREEKP